MEFLKLTMEPEKRLTAIENNHFCRILRIYWRDYAEIRAHKGQPNITSAVMHWRWRYLGHILRMPDHRLPQMLIHWQPEGTRHQWRPKNMLRKTHERDRRALQTSRIPEWDDIYAAAHLREDLRLLADDLCATGRTKIEGKVSRKLKYLLGMIWRQLE
jgi:hypothetical protein